jgi:cell division protein FtsI/penicillin-binding protein 2
VPPARRPPPRHPPPRRRPPPRRHQRAIDRTFALGALVVAIIGLGAATYVVWHKTHEAGPEDALKDFATAWSRGDDAAAADQTERPPAALAALKANRRGLDGAKVTATPGPVEDRGQTARATMRVTWNVPGIGRYSYRTNAALAHREEGWRVVWQPTLVHPRLDEDSRLGTVRAPAERGRILARDGRPIVRLRRVVRVGVERDKVRDPAAAAAAMARIVDVDRRAYQQAIERAGPQQFVEALTLREADAAKLEPQLDKIRGALAVEDRAPLAPSRAFARALLGTVSPATAEQLKKLGSRYAPGDSVGQWGLQAAYERRLAGTPDRRIVIRVKGAPTRTLRRRKGRAGSDLKTTLDIATQRAAESALGSTGKAEALVAVQPSTGDILAVANRPTDSSFDRALEGRYPPGSTFKVISTAALLRDGLNTSQVVDCPRTKNVGGRVFRNFEGGAQGPVPFARDFATSCNTAFVSLAGRLGANALTRTARDYGIGRPVKLPLRTGATQAPPGADAVARAATMIGQDKILATPLAMAGVAATVADGRWRSPRLVAGDPRRSGPPLPANEQAQLKTLMRSVVISGTGTALAGVPGEVEGKSGTAEFGPGDPPETHAWFIALRDDLAIAVLVERGRSGGSVAAPIAQRFFSALDASGAGPAATG